MNTELLNIHCEDRFARMNAVLTAFSNLRADERAAVLAAIKKDRDLPIRQSMATYREALAKIL